MGEISKCPPGTIAEIGMSQWTEPLWKAASEHRLVAARCADCGRFRMPPTPFCPYCRSQKLEWPTLSGHGTIFSYTIVTTAILPEIKDSLPYVIAVIELPDAGGTRLISNIVGADIDSLAVGLPVEVIWDDVNERLTIPRFRLATAEDAS